MKKALCFIVFVFSLLTYFTLTEASANEPVDFIKEREAKIESLYQKNNFLLAENRTSNVRPMIKNAESVLNMALEIKNKCDMNSDTALPENGCEAYSRIFTEMSVLMKLDIARYCTYKGLLTTAKKLYRNIITTYKDEAYSAYVKKAQISLKDL